MRQWQHLARNTQDEENKKNRTKTQITKKMSIAVSTKTGAKSAR
jgi:hypothetical protein